MTETLRQWRVLSCAIPAGCPRAGAAALRADTAVPALRAGGRGPWLRPPATIMLLLLLTSGCGTPQYAVRPTPAPDETASVVALEQEISGYQAAEMEKQGARLIQPDERLWGYDVHRVLTRLGQVTERPHLFYHAFLLKGKDPNAVALADGRVYITNGMLNYLAGRGSHEEELATILAHELGHTAAQHLVKRYRQMQQEQLALMLVGLGGSIAATQIGAPVGRLAQDVASLIASAANSSYSQADELEADQLGVRYLIRAGYDPYAAPKFLSAFAQFETPDIGFLRTHPYSQRRAEDLLRYLEELRLAGQLRPGGGRPARPDDLRARLLKAQSLYPRGSQSWTNLQRQLEILDNNSR